MKFQISAIQMKSEFGNIEFNINKAKNYVLQAINQNSKIIALPEGFIYGYDNTKTDEMIKNALDLDSKYINDFKKIAKKNEVFLIVPAFLKYQDSATNSSILINDNGEIINITSKSHPVGKERELIKRGDKYTVVNTKYGNIGMLICYDICFPETSRIIALKGADILFVPSAWRGTYYFNEWWDLNLACRALDNLFYVVAINQVGSTGEDEYFAGRSRILSPIGEVIACLNNGEGIVSANIDLERIKKERDFNTVLIDRHPEDYDFILEKNQEKE